MKRLDRSLLTLVAVVMVGACSTAATAKSIAPKIGPRAEALIEGNGHIEKGYGVVSVDHVGVGIYCVHLDPTIKVASVIPIVMVVAQTGHADAQWIPDDSAGFCPSGVPVGSRDYERIPSVGTRSDARFAIVVP